MPDYRLQYVCGTSLQFKTDVVLESRAGKATLMFSQKKATDNTVHALLESEGKNYRRADLKAQAILQPALDALSFSSGSPLLLLHWDLIIKNEAGSKARTALWCEKLALPAPLPLTDEAIDEARLILKEEEGPGLELCWHRHAIQRNLILDRFVFQWLAFEGLAGKRQIPTICPKCKTEVTHCDQRLSHEGSDSGNAHQLFSLVEPKMSFAEFKRELWGRTRNAVFHGSKYPSPDFLQDVNSLCPKLRKACDTEFNKRYKLRDRAKPTQGLDYSIYRYEMFEWQSTTPETTFAEDFPRGAAAEEFGNLQPGELRIRSPKTSPLRLLSFETDSKNW